jgi:hypothetical protein
MYLSFRTAKGINISKGMHNRSKRATVSVWFNTHPLLSIPLHSMWISREVTFVCGIFTQCIEWLYSDKLIFVCPHTSPEFLNRISWSLILVVWHWKLLSVWWVVLRPDNQGIMTQCPPWAGEFYLLQNVQTFSGAHPPLYSTGTGCRRKLSERETDHWPPYSAEVNNN